MVLFAKHVNENSPHGKNLKNLLEIPNEWASFLFGLGYLGEPQRYSTDVTEAPIAVHKM